jgi:hypothetical protein
LNVDHILQQEEEHTLHEEQEHLWIQRTEQNSGSRTRPVKKGEKKAGVPESYLKSACGILVGGRTLACL